MERFFLDLFKAITPLLILKYLDLVAKKFKQSKISFYFHDKPCNDENHFIVENHSKKIINAFSFVLKAELGMASDHTITVREYDVHADHLGIVPIKEEEDETTKTVTFDILPRRKYRVVIKSMVSCPFEIIPVDHPSAKIRSSLAMHWYSFLSELTIPRG